MTNAATGNGNVVAIINANGGAVALPSDLAATLAQYAQETRATEIVQGQFFSSRSGQLSFNKAIIPNNTMDVVILRSMWENVYYPEKFNSDKMDSPLCFAFSTTGADTLVPHGDVTKAQALSCGQCAHNKFAPDPVDGKNRKQCKEQRRLSCMSSSALSSPEAVKAAMAGYLRIPVTSVKFWQAYAQALAAGTLPGMEPGVPKPSFAVVTRITLKPDVKTQVRFEFEFVRSVTDPDIATALIARHTAEADLMSFPYGKRADAPAIPVAVAAAPVAAPAASKF